MQGMPILAARSFDMSNRTNAASCPMFVTFGPRCAAIEKYPLSTSQERSSWPDRSGHSEFALASRKTRAIPATTKIGENHLWDIREGKSKASKRDSTPKASEPELGTFCPHLGVGEPFPTFRPLTKTRKT